MLMANMLMDSRLAANWLAETRLKQRAVFTGNNGL